MLKTLATKSSNPSSNFGTCGLDTVLIPIVLILIVLGLVLVIDLQSVHETGLQSRFFCLAQNVFQSSVIYLYHKQDLLFSFLLVM